MQRKSFIDHLPFAFITGGAIGLSLLSPQIARADISYTGVGAGDASSDSIVLWTRTTDSSNQQGVATDLQVQLSPDPQFHTSFRFLQGTTDPNRDYTLKLPVTSLRSNTRYYYRFKATDGSLSTVGTFKTAPKASDHVPVRFGFSGDADGQWRPYASTQDFDKLKLDYLVWLGDTIYETASAGSPAVADAFANPTQALADYHRKYLEQLQPVNPSGFPDLRTFFSSQSHYTLLDNHELGNKQFINGGAPAGTLGGNGADATDPVNDVNTTGHFINKTPGFKTLVQAYDDYQPLREEFIATPDDPRTDGTQKLYFAKIWGANSIFINLDDRSYRDIRMKTKAGADDTGLRGDNPDRTMLGKTQLEWFKRVLLNAQTKGIAWKIIALSSPIDQIGVIGNLSAVSVTNGNFTTGSDGGKSWMGEYRAERNDLMKFIADNHITNVVFLSTDDHQVRINELDYSPTGQTADQSSYVRVPGNVFEIVAGPIGAGGPDGITDHSFANVKSVADGLAGQQQANGIDPIGLAPDYPGLQKVYREGDPDADSLRQPVDFYTPDTFNYAVLDIGPSGKTLSVNLYGINSYAANTFPEPNSSDPVRRILGFHVKNYSEVH